VTRELNQLEILRRKRSKKEKRGIMIALRVFAQEKSHDFFFFSARKVKKVKVEIPHAIAKKKTKKKRKKEKRD